MVNGEPGGLIVHAQQLVALDLKPELGLAAIRHHQMVAKPAWGLYRLKPFAILIHVQVIKSKNYFLVSIANIFLKPLIIMIISYFAFKSFYDSNMDKMCINNHILCPPKLQ